MAAARGNPQQSQFDARSDRAAQSLRQGLQQQGRQVTDTAPVEVGPDGRPPAPPPPEGSYIRQAMEQQRQQAQQQRVDLQDEPEGETQGEPAEGQPPDQDPERQPQETQPSENANRRIRELISELREKDQQAQQAIRQSQQLGETVQQLEQRLNALQQERDQVLSENLDHLDPEQRAEILVNQRVQQALGQVEQRIMGQLAPRLQRLDEQAIRSELDQVAHRYPRFDPEVHGPLIQRFRERNPACTIEQAFRAVAEPEELQLDRQERATVAPPTIAPGNNRSGQRYAPQSQEEPSDPHKELVEEAQQLKKLMREGSPEERKEASRLWHEHLKKRLS